ncbi:MAG TPA: PQQ-dependent sugar dehydrogenase [Vicinamibacterales bacterium]|nr:PQQ-dependent sugar dehydrogenase [Vicinamibacterales bacterium]
MSVAQVSKIVLITLLATAVGHAQAPVFETNAHKIRIVTIADGLSDAWSLAFLPNGDMLVTERTGGLRLIKGGVLQPEPIAGVPEVRYRNHGGMLDIALHPRFAENNLVYLTYSKPKDKSATTALWRARFDGTKLVDGKDIFVADAWTTSDVNFGSRMTFDRAGLLYMTIGERNFPFPQNQGMSAQDLDTHMGKILRLRDDGSVPPDNPFVNRPGHKPEIFSYGHRNPQGITIHPETGEVWASEHGPLGGDEVNILLPGRNYGWPLITYGRGYDGKIITEDTKREGMEQPRFYWVPSIGITNLLFYTGDRFPMWRGQLLVAGHGAMQVQRVRLEGRGTNERELIVTNVLRRRFRDLRQGPDGLLYLVTSDREGQPKTGAVLRIEPAD